ncbi:hypothetical protein Golob_008062 [Gossypium lobatum]|uniref:DUF3511 domain-containing protein n=1 Tax=Gossypium lobatum TaxID=34289 RepID=A0A7J8MEJ1_9ROSI|nr:hypothetical protein [Gossypium lobatum]
MESYGSGQRPNGADRRMEIVSGKNTSVGSNQIYSTTRSRSPDLPPVPTRTSQGSSKPWGFTDPEMRRKKRIAKYKVYTVEGKMKASLSKGLRWIKNKCSQIVHGY